jgi:hypothetical protein
MSMRKKPCAYCGSTSTPRTKGHVLGKAIYPSVREDRTQWITVPECDDCKALWEDAESHFRNVILVAGAPNTEATSIWGDKGRRSFREVDGKRRVRDILFNSVPTKTADGSCDLIFPDRDERVMLILRKIARGLCHHHQLGTAISDTRVTAIARRVGFPEELQASVVARTPIPRVCDYAYVDFSKQESDLHSIWSLRFFERTWFFALVASERCKKTMSLVPSADGLTVDVAFE